MKAQTEQDIVNSCLQFLNLKGIMAWRNQTTGTFDPMKSVFRSFRGMRGVSDILGIVKVNTWRNLQDEPCCPFGVFLAIETKKKGKYPTPDQKLFLHRIKENGGYALVIRDVKELEAWATAEGL